MADSASSSSNEQENIVVPRTVIQKLVKNLCMTFSSINLYSWNHPATKNVISQGWETLSQSLEEYGDLLLTVAGQNIMFQTEPVDDKNPGVKRLARTFDSYAVSSVSFCKAMVADEYESFFRVFSSDPSEIQDQGGIGEVLKKEGIANIKTNSTVYKLVHEDEEVVNIDQVGTGGDEEVEAAEKQVVRAFVEDVLQRTSNVDELVSKIAEEPDKVADQVAKILDFSEDALGDDQLEKILEGLTENIENAALSASSPVLRAMPKKQQQMAKAFEKLEKEIRRKTKRLSSEKGMAFVKHITELVSSSASTARAEALLAEFLESNRSLNQTKKMLRSLSRTAAKSQDILDALNKLLEERDLKADELVKLVQDDIDARNKRAARKKPSKSLMDRISGKIHKDFDFPGKDELITYLDGMITKEINTLVKDQTEELKENLDQTQSLLKGLSKIIGKVQIGAVVLDPDGAVASSIGSDIIPQFAEGEELPEELLDALEQIEEDTIVEYMNVRIVETHHAEDGVVTGFVFVPIEEGAAEE